MLVPVSEHRRKGGNHVRYHDVCWIKQVRTSKQKEETRPNADSREIGSVLNGVAKHPRTEMGDLGVSTVDAEHGERRGQEGRKKEDGWNYG